MTLKSSRAKPSFTETLGVQFADRDLECQLGQAAAAAAAAVAGRAAAGRRLPAGDQARRRRVRASCSATSSTQRGYAFAAHGEATWNGVAILSRVGPRRRRRRASVTRRPASRTPRRERSPPPAAVSGCTRSTCRTAARPTPTTTATSSPGWPRCGRPSAPARRRRSSAATSTSLRPTTTCSTRRLRRARPT